MNRRHYVGLFLLSLATLLLELALTRVLSVALWYHFGFLVISTALLGFGTSGVVLALWTDLRERVSLDHGVAGLSLAFGVATIVSFWLMQHIPFEPFNLLADSRQLLFMPLYYLALAAPFFCSGLAIALLFTRGAQEVNRLYAVDLLGAGIGCAAIAVVMPALGGSGCVIVAATLGFFAATVFGLTRAGRLSVTGALLGFSALALASVADRAFPITVTSNKQHPLRPATHQPIYTAWNTFSRIDVYELPAAPEEGWPDSGFAIVIDGGAAATGMGNLRVGVRNYLAHSTGYHPSGLPYLGKVHPKVLVMGSGAGREVLEALYFGASSVTAVEINPIINEIVSRRMRDSWGGLFEQPEVHLVTDEGRSFLRRSKEKYDAIISIQTITNAAIASGALTLAEGYMFTREAFEEYLDHLTEDGVLLITRPTSQLARLFATAREVFEQRGLGSPAKHLFAFRAPLLQWGPRLAHTGFLFKKSPLTQGELRMMAERLGVAGTKGGIGESVPPEILYSPLESRTGSIFDLLMTAPDLRAVYAAQAIELSPATDDRPFFNQQTRWSRLGLRSFAYAFMLGQKKLGTDQPVAEMTLVMMLGQSIVVAAVFIALPLARSSRGGFQTQGYLAFLAYFACLGLGFIMIEIAFLQRFTLFLGQPVYTLAVVLASLLVSSGVGSYTSGRLRGSPHRVLSTMLLALLAALALTALVTPSIFSAALGLALLWRIAISAALIAPLGILLGMPFPMGLSIVANRSSALVPWAWGVNGFFTVIGSVGAMMLGMILGFKAVLAIAGGCYLAAWVAMGLTKKRSGISSL